MLNCVTWIQIALSCILKPKTFTKILLLMLTDGLIHKIIIKKRNRPLPIGRNKKVIGKLKDELGGKIMIKFSTLRAKAYAFKLDHDNEAEKAKGTEKCIVKREITFKN